jgi:poly(hydroxyalkanoate) depolymerase family esterase
MTRIFAAALRRATRLLRPARSRKSARSVQKMMAGLMQASRPAKVQPKAAKRHKAPLSVVGQSLEVVMKQMRAVQSLMPGVAQTPKPPVISPSIPKGAQFVGRTHRSASGTRGYLLYLPTSQPKRPRGLILMLHGCTQTPQDFAAGTHMNAQAEKHGLAVAYPTQTASHNAASCWNWFKPGDQTRGSGEPAILASLTRKLMKEFGLGREAVFVAGLSAGGAMAATLADVYPDIFSAAGVHSGLARGSARDVLSAMLAMRNGTASGTVAPTALPADLVRRIIFQGEADSTVHPSNAATIVAAAMGGDAKPSRVTKRAVRGRAYSRSEFAGPDGATRLELWMIEGSGHAWSGGRVAGSYTDPKGPDASAQMIRFFLSKSA